jgi:hypothetical protein
MNSGGQPMATDTILPSGFEDLSRYLPQWLHATEIDRNRFRVARALPELQDFYDTMMPRLEDIANFLNDFPLDALPRECANLLELALMAMEVAPATEYYNSPDVPNAVEHEKFRIFPLRNNYAVVDAVTTSATSS